MSLSTIKIADNERNLVRMEGKDDPLDGTLAQNQAEFDEYPELIRTRFNLLCDMLVTMPTYHTVSTAAATTAKTAITTYVPIGTVIEIVFTNGNTAVSPTIEVYGESHNFSGLPTTAKLSDSANQTYRVVRSDATTLTFIQYPDYICEYGTDSSGTRYEKWAGGTSRCSNQDAALTMSIPGAFGSFYRYISSGTNGVGLTLPAIFSADPTVMATLQSSSTTKCAPHGYFTGTGPYVAHLQYLSTATVGTTTSQDASFTVVGKWK